MINDFHHILQGVSIYLLQQYINMDIILILNATLRSARPEFNKQHNI